MTHIHIGGPEIKYSRVEFDLKIPLKFKRYIKSDVFWVRYDQQISNCPEGILNIPPVITIAPIAWAKGHPISTTVLEKNFFDSLQKLYNSYQSQYPSVFDCELSEVALVDEVVSYPKASYDSGSSVLYSGGIDSLTSYLTHREECSSIFTIHGADIAVENAEGWERINRMIEPIVESESLSHFKMSSNFRDILRDDHLTHHLMKDIDRGWWGAIQYGTALPALCAPITYLKGIGHIYQGSGYTQDSEYPTAQPSFVDNLFWNSTKSKITEPNITRQEKIRILKEKFEELDMNPVIRSCYLDRSGTNCSTCEKCRRTMLGLAVEGMDPNEFGYDCSEKTLHHIRDDLEQGQLHLEGLDKHMWQSIQQRSKTMADKYKNDSDFYDWFEHTDLESYSSDRGMKNMEWYIKQLILHMPYPIDIAMWDMAVSLRKRYM